MQQLMLEKLSGTSSRLPVHVVPLPYIHIGQHWRADARSRWDTVMSSRFSVVQELARCFLQDWLPSQHGTLRGMSCGFAFLV